MMKTLWNVIRREILIIRKRPVYLLASVGVLFVNTVFYLSFFKDGLPHDLPIGVVDEDCSSTSRTFADQLDATQLGKVIYYDDLHLARADMQSGRIDAFVVLPKGFNADIQANRQPHIGYYVNSLYFVGGALAYKDILTMVNLTNGAVQREVLRAKGVNEREIMNRIQPIVLDQHQIGNPATNYGVYLNGVILPGVLEMIVILITIYAVGSELKYGTSRHLMRTTGGSIEMALLGKLFPYNIIFTLLGIGLELLLFHWLKYPLKGSLWWMCLNVLLLVSASEALGLFIIELFPVLRVAISVGAIISVLAFSLSGFSLPVEAMPSYVQGFSAIFPLRHYYLFHAQETIWGSGFAGWWQEVVHLLLFMFLPAVFMKRLEAAYVKQDYERD
ncbi:MAG: ABC transporter permease [Bacteroidales bacterium]|nr:ABC transporter permease [Bacteroidales bacterium]